MKVINIIANRETIEFVTDPVAVKKAQIVCYSPALGNNLEICHAEFAPEDGKYVIPRFHEEDDLVFARFELTVDGEALCGKQYVESIAYSERTFDYPTADTKKGLQIGNLDDAVALGVKHIALNINEGDIMMTEPEEGNTIEFVYDGGRTFYFNKSRVEENDKRIKDLSDRGMIITYILLNSKKWNIQVPEDLWEIIKHPDYDKLQDGKGRISQFNVVTEEGVAYYKAFIAFLSERYTREDEKYGRVVGMIVGNEVNSGYEWCNSGEMTCEEYCRHYSKALRLTYQAACTVYSNMRIYISLDHFWTGANFDQNPMRYYSSKSILENVNNEFLAEGQVPWNVAHHPYPENLALPDFWNDQTATDDMNTYRITFKNLEVLAKVLYQEEYLYNGQRRRIILSEQGFNSHWTPESEILQAVAYGRAYKKVMQIPEVDSFILHAYRDNYFEFGLNLGLLRRKKDSNEVDGPKPIYYVFKAIDKKDEKGVYHWERY